MDGEQELSQVRRRFEIGKDVHEEIVGVRVPRVQVAIMDIRPCVALAVVKDDDFVDAKNSKSARDLAC